nr:MAG TPA: tail tape measure protein [Caudoviricetes sp.]
MSRRACAIQERERMDSMGYDGSLKFDTEINEKGFNSGLSKMGSLAQTALGVFSGQMMTRAVDGIANLGKSALEAVSSMEQNIGGVETLFKDSAQAVIDSANIAYKTAGMSANEYMSTVTSFSASLLQSLGGDTEKAAQIADMAIIDMSDNANKMGTSMELIQNAYQGFAKQNYTMLDNLKLGYGGTKTEMERLIADANKVKEANGEMADLSIDSFADVTEAIHIIQEEMGITGTTAKEAASTIEGSVNSAKAAWDNFLTGSITAEEFAESFSTAAFVILKNLAEIIPRLASTIPAIAVSLCQQLATAVQEGGSEMLSSAGTFMLNSLTNGIVVGIPQLLAQGSEMLHQYQSVIQTNFPVIMQNGVSIITNLLTGILSAAPQIIAQVGEMMTTWVDTVLGMLPTILDSGSQMIQNLLQGLVENAPKILQQAFDMTSNFIQTILSHLPSILQAGVNLILNLLSGLVQAAPQIIQQAAQMLAEFISTIASHLPEILQKGIEIVGELIAGLISRIPDVISSTIDIISSIQESFDNIDWVSIGLNIIDGIVSGIISAAGSLVDAAVGAAEDAVEAVKDWLGIASPSKLMRDEVGKYMALGMGIGFEKNVPTEEMTDRVSRSVEQMRGAAEQVTSRTPITAIQASKTVSDNYTDAKLDHRKLKKLILEAINEANEKPIVLNGRQMNRFMREEGFVKV